MSHQLFVNRLLDLGYEREPHQDFWFKPGTNQMAQIKKVQGREVIFYSRVEGPVPGLKFSTGRPLKFE